MAWSMDQAVTHPGPLNVWLSKSPGDVKDYDGSGAWAKIFEMGADISASAISFPATGKSTFEFEIPSCVCE